MNNERQQILKRSDVGAHLSNERTFLAWIRTCIGIMAFGFVVEKFALFIKEFTLMLGTTRKTILPYTVSSLQGYSSSLGMYIVALGILISLMAFTRYIIVRKQIENDIYQPTIVLNVFLTLCVLLIGVILIVVL